MNLLFIFKNFFYFFLSNSKEKILKNYLIKFNVKITLNKKFL